MTTLPKTTTDDKLDPKERAVALGSERYAVSFAPQSAGYLVRSLDKPWSTTIPACNVSGILSARNIAIAALETDAQKGGG